MHSHETSVYHAVLITAIVLGSLLGFFLYLLFRQQRRKVMSQRAYFGHDIQLLENERSRVSRDLHDGGGMLLSVLKLHIGELPVMTEEDRKRMEKIHELIDEVIRRLGVIAANLSPRLLARKGLRQAIDRFLEETREVFRIEIDFRYEVETTMDADAAIHLFRIVQEVTHNTVKHAHAKRLSIHFKEKKEKLYVYCRDDGIGFEMEDGEEKGEGMGLGSLRSRTALLAGKMSCTSKPKHGTEYFFEFPFAGGAPAR